jgi:hypothetical protein
MKIKGAFPVRWAAQDGAPGVGVTIESTAIKYAESTSGTTHPSSGWVTSVPQNIQNGNYLWTWTHIQYSDGTQTDAYSVARWGIDGRGIQSSVVTYSQQATTVDPTTITDWGAFPSSLTDGYWLYTKTHIVYSDQASTDSYSVSQVGVGSYYAGCEEHYKEGDSPTTAPQGAITPGTYTQGTLPSTTWGQTRPTLTESYPYLWNFEISYDSRGNAYVTAAICIGNFAKGISNIVQTYAISASDEIDSQTHKPVGIADNDWTDEANQVPPTSAKPYMWNKTVTTYNDNSTETTYHICAVAGRGTVYIDLDNESDILLYDREGNKVGSNLVSIPKLYDNGVDVTSNATFSISDSSGCMATIDSLKRIIVSAMSQNSGYVRIQCTYRSAVYYATMTLKRQIGGDRYYLIVTPNAVCVNTDSGDTPPSLVAEVWKLSADDGTDTHLSSLPSGFSVKFNDVTKSYSSGACTIPISDYSPGMNVFKLYSGSNKIEDTETVPVVTVENGDNGVSVEAQYAPNPYPTAAQIHDSFQSGDLYMRTRKTSDTNWGSWMRIIGENGEGTDYTSFQFGWSTQLSTSSVTTAPTLKSGTDWTDGPTANPSTSSTTYYMWMKVVYHTWDSNTRTWSNGTPKYQRVTGEKGDTGTGIPGNNAKSVYCKRFNTPTTPTGSAPASPWAGTVPSRQDMSVECVGDFARNDLGWWVSPPIVNGGDTIELIRVVTTAANQTITLHFECDATSYSKLYVSAIDSSTIPSSGDGCNMTRIYTFTASSVGVHTIRFKFHRGNNNGDKTVRFRVGDPHIWRSDALTFNGTSVATWSTPYLVSYGTDVLSDSQGANILRQTAFESGKMDCWEKQAGTINPQAKDGHNSFIMTARPDYSYTEGLYQELVSISGGAITEQRLKTNTWYTLSFWARSMAEIDLGISASGYTWGMSAGWSPYKNYMPLYLSVGVPTTIKITGRVNQAAVNTGRYLTVFVWSQNESGSWLESKGVDFTTATDTTKTITFTPSYSEYRIGFYMYKTGEEGSDSYCDPAYMGYVSGITVNRGMKFLTYLYPNVASSEQPTYTLMDVNAGRYKDGVMMMNGSSQAGTPNDNNAEWQLTTEWSFHTLTFKTRDTLPVAAQAFLMRTSTYSNDTEVCMVKIEEGTHATPYSMSDQDSSGISGCMIRTTDWVAGVQYHNDEGLTLGNRYIDCVTYQDRMYRCKVTHTSSNNNKPSTTGTFTNTYWEVFSNSDPIYTPLLFADNAIIKFAQSQRIAVMDNGVLKAGLQAGDWPIWAGGANPAEAPFRVNKDGSVYGTKASFSGDSIFAGLLQAARGTFAGELQAAGGTFGGNLDAAGGIFHGGIRSPYKIKNSSYTLNLPDDSCILAYNTSGTITITIPAISQDSASFNGLEVRIARFYYGSATVNVQINGTVMNQHNDTRITSGRTVSLGKGKEVMLRAVLFSYSGQASGYWLFENSRDFE